MSRTMNAKNVIACAAGVLLVIGLAGCSGRRASWWNKPQGVPITRPTSQDPNITFADPAPVAVAAVPAPVAAVPAPAPVTPAPAPVTPAPAPVAAAPAPAPVAAAPAPVAAAPTPAQSPMMSPDANRGESAGTPPTPEPTTARSPEPATPPAAAAKPIDKPMELTDLINAPKVKPRLREIEPVVTTMPVTRVRRPPPPPTAAPVQAPVRTFVPPNQTAKPVGPDEVVAASVVQVNRQFISVDDILRPLGARLDKLPKNIDEPTFRDQAARLIGQEITGQITRRLVVEEAEKRLVDDQKKVVDHEVKQAHVDMLAAAGGSITKLRQQFQAEGLTLEEALDDYRRDAMFKLYLRHRFIPAIPVTRKMLWDYYRQNHGQFSTGRKSQMQIVAAPLAEFLADPTARPSQTELANAKAKARQVIDAAKARLDAGDDFSTTAKKYSHGIKATSGGLWPLMEAGSFKETAVEKAAFQLPAGAVSDPIETPHGWYLVKAVQVIPGRVIPFEEAQEQITETLRSRMYEELTDKYFQDLLKKSHIVRSPKFNELALDRATDRFWNK